jgi:hypothetical protein
VWEDYSGSWLTSYSQQPAVPRNKISSRGKGREPPAATFREAMVAARTREIFVTEQRVELRAVSKVQHHPMIRGALFLWTTETTLP